MLMGCDTHRWLLLIAHSGNQKVKQIENQLDLDHRCQLEAVTSSIGETLPSHRSLWPWAKNPGSRWNTGLRSDLVGWFWRATRARSSGGRRWCEWWTEKSWLQLLMLMLLVMLALCLDSVERHLGRFLTIRFEGSRRPSAAEMWRCNFLTFWSLT